MTLLFQVILRRNLASIYPQASCRLIDFGTTETVEKQRHRSGSLDRLADPVGLFAKAHELLTIFVTVHRVG